MRFATSFEYIVQSVDPRVHIFIVLYPQHVPNVFLNLS